MSRLISDEDIVRRWPVFICKPPITTDIVHGFARRIESLVRKRLAERIRAAAKNEDELALQWEKQIQEDDKDAMMGFNMCQLRKAGIEDAARLVESDE